MIKTEPASAGKQLAAKFLMAYLPALILAGLAGINLVFGVRGASLTWTDPREMESGAGGRERSSLPDRGRVRPFDGF